jgi:UDP-N-acetyl-D-mannosaminuronic acid transferase (WecB/TagA/CpsF family)
MDLNIPDALSILGVSVDLFDTYEQVMNLIHGRITSQLPTFCVAINPEKIYRAGLDMQLKAALDGAHIRICDGIGVSLASLLLHRRPLKRCTGIDLFLSLVQFAAAFLNRDTDRLKSLAISTAISTIRQQWSTILIRAVPICFS